MYSTLRYNGIDSHHFGFQEKCTILRKIEYTDRKATGNQDKTRIIIWREIKLRVTVIILIIIGRVHSMQQGTLSINNRVTRSNRTQ